MKTWLIYIFVGVIIVITLIAGISLGRWSKKCNDFVPAPDVIAPDTVYASYKDTVIAKQKEIEQLKAQLKKLQKHENTVVITDTGYIPASFSEFARIYGN